MDPLYETDWSRHVLLRSICCTRLAVKRVSRGNKQGREVKVIRVMIVQGEKVKLNNTSPHVKIHIFWSVCHMFF